MSDSNLMTLFGEALQCPSPEARSAYLANIADSGLRRQVEQLLQAHQRAGGFLGGTGGPSPETAAGAPAERPGTVIGPYKLLQQIGEGGMGVVWMAEQTQPVHRKVAIKVIKPGMDSRQVIARFEAERQALAMMDHVNIARVFDGGTTGEPSRVSDRMEGDDIRGLTPLGSPGRPYFVMELVHGIPITKYCDDNHLTPRERLELFVPVCQAIQHAHQKGIIHRDIKPSNVMVTLYDGKPVPKVIDFGVAKATEQKLTERTLFTQYGAMVGTLEYMSPEQAEMSALGVDTRSDIYSLGVLLYELLTGSTPLTSKRMKEAAYAEILRMIKEEEPPKPSTRLSDSGEALASISSNRHTEPAKLSKLMRGELDWIVMKTLEKDRNRRYETAKDFAADVQRYLDDETVQACPPSAGYRFRKFARRNKRALATMTVMAVAVLVTMAALTVSNVLIQSETAQKEEALKEKTGALAAAEASEKEAKVQERLAKVNADQAETERRAAVAQEKIAKQEELTARRRFYAAQTNLAMQALEAGDPARTLELLETQRPRFDQQDLRSFEWYYLWRLCHRGLRSRLNHHAGPACGVVFFRDGKTLASVGPAIKLWDVATAQEKATLRGHAWALSISPDGKTLATWGFGDPVRLWDAGSGNQQAVFKGTNSCTFSPDGKTVAVTRGAAVEFWDVAGKQRHSVLHVKERTTAVDYSFQFAPDGKTALARLDADRLRIYRWDGANWQEGSEIAAHGWFLPTAISRDGKTFAVGGDVGSGNLVKLYAADTGKELSALAGHTGIVYSVAFSPDGKSLASAGGDRTVRLWDLATRKQQTSYPHPGPVFSVAYAPDGKSLASAGAYGTVRLWDTAPEEAPSVLQRWGNTVAFSPDGRTLATSGFGVTLFDVATGQPTATLGKGEGLLAMSNDGNRLAVTHGNDVQLWDLIARRQYALLEGHSQNIFSLMFSPDDKTLATASRDETVRLWDIATRETRITLKPGKAISAVAFSPGGQTLATGSQYEYVQLWDAQTGRELLMLQGHDPQGAGPWCWALAFSADGKTLAAASQTGLVRLWDTATARLRASLQGHTASVNCVAFAPDGNTLATASDDRTVRLWDTATGQEKIALKGHGGSVRTIAFSRDGGTLASGSSDGTVRLWRTSKEQEAKTFRTELNSDEPDSPAALLDAAGRLLRSGRADEAHQAYEKASARLEKLAGASPNDAEYPKRLGAVLAAYRGVIANLYARSAQWDKAAAEYTKAIELKPDEWEAWSGRALVHLHRQRWDEAVSDFSRAIDLAPQVHTNWWHRGHVYLQVAQWDKAAADFGKVVDQWPDGAEGWYLRGVAFAQLNQPDKALADLRQAIVKGFNAVGPIKTDSRLAPLRSHDDFKKLLDELEQKEKKKRDEAIAALRKAIELDPKSAKAHNQLGAALRAQGSLDEAIACHRKAIELDPKSASGHKHLGHTLQAQGKLDEAIACYRSSIELEPKSAWAHNALSYALGKKGWDLANAADPKLRDLKRSVELGNEAIGVTPQSPMAWQYLGWIQYRAGNWKASIEALEKSCKLQEGGTGDFGQWIVLTLAHDKLAAHADLPDKEREHHKAGAHRRYEQADKQIDSRWRVRPSDEFGQAIWDFRAEARELLGVKDKKEQESGARNQESEKKPD